MDFILSPSLLSGAVSVLLLGPAPIWQDLPGMFADSAPAVEQQVSAPTPPSIDSILALPDGFRAPGYEGRIFRRSNSNAGN